MAQNAYFWRPGIRNLFLQVMASEALTKLLNRFSLVSITVNGQIRTVIAFDGTNLFGYELITFLQPNFNDNMLGFSL